jgi:hypothetical protein
MFIETTVLPQSTYPIVGLCGSCVSSWTGPGTEACDVLALLSQQMEISTPVSTEAYVETSECYTQGVKRSKRWSQVSKRN